MIKGYPLYRDLTYVVLGYLDSWEYFYLWTFGPFLLSFPPCFFNHLFPVKKRKYCKVHPIFCKEDWENLFTKDMTVNRSFSSRYCLNISENSC